MIGGVETVCTGVGSAKDNPAWSAYPVKLVFANPAGENLAQVHVAVMQGARPVVETDCDAPWLLMKLPAGSYNVAATVPGRAGAPGRQGQFCDQRAGRAADHHCDARPGAFRQKAKRPARCRAGLFPLPN